LGRELNELYAGAALNFCVDAANGDEGFEKRIRPLRPNDLERHCRLQYSVFI